MSLICKKSPIANAMRDGTFIPDLTQTRIIERYIFVIILGSYDDFLPGAAMIVPI